MAGGMGMTDNYLAKTSSVLLVDDEPDILELLELALRKMGLEVDRAGNVREALTKLAARRYDLCLTDMRLPDGDGLQVVQHIAQHNLDVPVAVITAHGNMENAVTQVESHRVEVQLAGLDFGKIQDVVQDPQQRIGRVLDDCQVLPLPRREIGIQGDLRHAQDAIHGCADFVAHVRQKLALGAAAGFGGLFERLHLREFLRDDARLFANPAAKHQNPHHDGGDHDYGDTQGAERALGSEPRSLPERDGVGGRSKVEFEGARHDRVADTLAVYRADPRDAEYGPLFEIRQTGAAPRQKHDPAGLHQESAIPSRIELIQEPGVDLNQLRVAAAG